MNSKQEVKLKHVVRKLEEDLKDLLTRTWK